MTNFDLSTEKLTEQELIYLEACATACVGIPSVFSTYTAITQAQIEKSRAYHAQQTGDKDLEQKIRDILCDDEQEHFTNEYYEEMKVGSGVWYITKVERLSTLLSQELAKRDEEWNKYTDMHDDVLLDQIDELKARLKEHKNALEFARGAIGDAIYLEDGLDGGAGQIVINMITEVLDDKDEYESTFKDGE